MTCIFSIHVAWMPESCHCRLGLQYTFTVHLIIWFVGNFRVENLLGNPELKQYNIMHYTYNVIVSSLQRSKKKCMQCMRKVKWIQVSSATKTEPLIRIMQLMDCYVDIFH